VIRSSLAAVSVGIVAFTGCAAQEEPAPEPSPLTVATTYRDGSLIPGMVTDAESATIVNTLYTPLVTYDAATSAPVMANAAEITSEDNITWKVQLRPDFSFHDGTPVLAANYLQSWNWVARCETDSPNQYYLGPSVMNVQGYGDVSGKTKADGTRDCAGLDRSLRGLTVLDDYSFRITLNDPQPALPSMLGHWALSPMSDQTLAALQPSQNSGGGAAPVALTQASPSPSQEDPTDAATGNGPYRLARDTGSDLQLERYEDYPDTSGLPAAVTFNKYANLTQAYDSFGPDELDVLPQVPVSALSEGQWQQHVPEGQSGQRPGDTLTSLTFPMYEARYQSADLRLALAAAIDRGAIAANAFADTRQGAQLWAPEPAFGATGATCEQACGYDAPRARQLFAQSQDTGEPITIAFNKGGGHTDWVAQACEWITDAIGVPCEANEYQDSDAFFADVEDKKMTGPFVTSWKLEYPDVAGFLGPLYGSGGVNDGGYENEAFLNLIDEAALLPRDQAQAKYEDAARQLNSDPPATPTFLSDRQLLWSSRIVADSVRLTPFGLLDVTGLQTEAATPSAG